MNDFMTWFQTGNASVVHAGYAPHSWQVDLASCLQCTNRLIRIVLPNRLTCWAI